MTAKRIRFLKEFLSFSGIEPDRLRLEWVSSAEATRFVEVITDFIDQVKELGPSPLKAALAAQDLN